VERIHDSLLLERSKVLKDLIEFSTAMNRNGIREEKHIFISIDHSVGALSLSRLNDVKIERMNLLSLCCTSEITPEE
jgi:hypothetical protein